MGLPKGWLSAGLGSLLSKGIIGIAREAIGAFDLPVPDDVSSLAEVDGIPATWGLKGMSWVGATLGSPLGLLPFLTIVYQAGLAENQANDARRAYRPSRIPPDVYARLVHRGYIDPSKDTGWTQDIHEQGWSQERVDALMESYRVLLTTGEVRELYLRGKLGEGDASKTEAIARIMQHGITEADAIKLFDIFFYIPPVQDLVNWSAKEVFEPEMRKKYGLDDEFEKLDLSLYAQTGVSPEQARNYWRAHWQHPGLTTIQELLHRTDFTEADFWEWFKLVEIPPYWRDKLIQIAYNPFTRVDIRRMYREGVLNKQEVIDAYHEIGSDDWHAGKLAEWTFKHYAPEDTSEDKEVRDLTKAEILRGYEDKVIPRELAINGLLNIDYSPSTAEFLVILRDVKIAEARTKEELSYIGGAYKLGLLSDAEMEAKLGNLDLTGEQQEYYVEKFRRTDTQKVVVPSKADFKRWLKLEIISVPIFRDYLVKQGYITEHIEYYVKEVDASERQELPSGG